MSRLTGHSILVSVQHSVLWYRHSSLLQFLINDASIKTICSYYFDSFSMYPLSNNKIMRCKLAYITDWK